MEKNSKIFIAGHRGLVGSAIYANLKSKGYTNLLVRSRLELDLTDPVATRIFFEREKPEYVVLAAAHVGGIAANNIYRADFIYLNLQIQQNVIGESWRHGVKKLLFLGSTCIYPREAPQPMAEECLLTSPLEYTNEPYAVAKIAGLKMCESFNLQYGTNFIAVMPTNLYGPNDNFDLETGHVLPVILRKIHLAHCRMTGNWETIRRDLSRRPVKGVNGNEPDEKITALLERYGIYKDTILLWGTGTPKREFLWSGELADACVFMMERIDFSHLKEYAAARGCPPEQIRNCHVNIGTEEEISIRELAEHVAEVIGYGGKLRFDSSKPDGVLRKLTDCTKLHELGWRHKIGVREGVQRLYRWYLDNLFVEL